MEECHICLALPTDDKWKELFCSHKMCFSCFLKLQNQTCPFCRKEFKYTQEEIKTRHALNISYKPYTPPSQLTNINDIFNSFNQLNIDDNDYNIPYSRINRNRFRKRRRNLSEEEIKERRRIIKEKCRKKWTYKENRLKKWYEISLD